MRRYILLFVLMVAAGLSGCGKSSTEEETTAAKAPKLEVGFSQLGAESDWRVANTESIKNSLSAENGIDLMFDDAQQKQDKQLLAIRNFTQQEMDYIVLAPVTEDGWDTVLEEAKNAEIPIIVVDRMVNVSDTSLYKAWVGSDFKREGRIAAEWLRRFTELKNIEPSSVNIVDIQGTIGATAQIGRSDAIVEGAEKNGWKLLAQEPADYTQAKAKEVMLRLLSQHKDINVVYAENDNEAMGVIEAIEQTGRKVGTDIENGEIMIISFDAARSGLTKVLEGKIALDIECNPLQGEEILKLIKAIENGEEYQKYTYVEEEVFSTIPLINEVEVNDEKYPITMLTEDILNRREY